MSFEDTIRQIVREENEKHLANIKELLDSYTHEDTPKTLSVKEAAKILGFGVTKTYEMIKQAEHTGFPYLKDGCKVRIPYQALINWMNQRAKQVI
ncbi:helix-turn-helix domain-containing protein [Virgibacillus salarius]|uniref:helix-turn-helix domain-containing protein n=1 Tax=Virgibacillus salarius TaxID=447199 RepID=UPI0024934F8E|nr:helix-turn-helix domain-containing protein [Virgibacillus salarius]WBX81329.1 helix-turn-helix domain-containing protein [Virgibacillus salarius]